MNTVGIATGAGRGMGLAGISPTMADWRRVLTVDLAGTALLAEALRPLVTAGTAMVCFASWRRCSAAPSHPRHHRRLPAVGPS